MYPIITLVPANMGYVCKYTRKCTFSNDIQHPVTSYNLINIIYM